MPITKKQQAQWLIRDAGRLVENGHTGSITNWAAHAVSQKARSIQGTPGQATETAVAVGLTAVAIGLTIASAGLAVPILIAMGAGGYALKKFLGAVNFERARTNRNWLRKYPNAQINIDSKDPLSETCDAADAIRRAVDHYNIANDIHKSLAAGHFTFSTCDELIGKATETAGFIHHTDKVRNYLLPCYAVAIFYLEQYKIMAEQWEKLDKGVTEAVESWLAKHSSFDCRERGLTSLVSGPSGHCYNLNQYGNGPIHAAGPYAYAPEHLWGTAGPTSGSRIELSELITKMKTEGMDKLVKEMHLQLAAPPAASPDPPKRVAAPTFNYSAARPQVGPITDKRTLTEHVPPAPPGSAASGAGTRFRPGYHLHIEVKKVPQGTRERLDKLLDDCWRGVDRPGYLERAKRKISHAYTRRTGGEIAATLIGEGLSLGGCFLPFVEGAHGLTELAKVLVKDSTEVASGAVGILALPNLAVAGQPSFKSETFNSEHAKALAMRDATGSGAVAQRYLTKVFTHFKNAVKAIQELEKVQSASITRCDQAIDMARKTHEVLHEMSKVHRYLVPLIALIDAMSATTIAWTREEKQFWTKLEKGGTDLIWNHEDRLVCPKPSDHCYGPRSPASPQTPIKPL